MWALRCTWRTFGPRQQERYGWSLQFELSPEPTQGRDEADQGSTGLRVVSELVEEQQEGRDYAGHPGRELLAKRRLRVR
jgi:hypothetical protein